MRFFYKMNVKVIDTNDIICTFSVSFKFVTYKQNLLRTFIMHYFDLKFLYFTNYYYLDRGLSNFKNNFKAS